MTFCNIIKFFFYLDILKYIESAVGINNLDLRLMHRMYSRSLTANINHLPMLIRMNEIVRMFPQPLLLTFLDTSMIDVTDNATRWYPYNGTDNYYSTHYVIFQKTHNFINIYIFDDVPKSFHYILNRFLTYALKE